MSTPPVQCCDCRRVRTLCARGLCQPCYKANWKRGTLHKFTLLGRRCNSGHPGKKILLEEYTHMRSLLGHEGAVWRLCDAFSIDEITLRKSLEKYERQAA